MVNMCLDRKGNIDFALLLVMFSWIGATIFYVIHFISWNNKEIARHKSYISSLEAVSVQFMPSFVTTTFDKN